MKNCPTCLAKLPKDFTLKGKHQCRACLGFKPESEFGVKKKVNPRYKQITAKCKACIRKEANTRNILRRDELKKVEENPTTC